MTKPQQMPASAEPPAEPFEVAQLRAALRGFREAFANRGETTSLHEWQQRMKAADANAAVALEIVAKAEAN